MNDSIFYFLLCCIATNFGALYYELVMNTLQKGKHVLGYVDDELIL